MTTATSLPLTSANPQTSPLITIIVAVYNNASTLQRCIDSVASQSYPHKELVIIDGGSTDGTVEIIKQNSDKIASWVSEPDKGIYNAFNKGVDRANGEWIYFLGSDDYLWNDEVLSSVAQGLNNINNDDDVKLVYGKVALISPRGDILEILNKPWDEIKNIFFLKPSPINHQGVFHHNSLFKIHGKFDESFSISGDYDLMMRVLNVKESTPIFLKDIIAARQVGGISSRPLSGLKFLKEDHQARINNGIFNNYNFRLLISYYFKTMLKSYIKIIIRWILIKINPQFTMYVGDLYRMMTGRLPIWTKSYLPDKL